MENINKYLSRAEQEQLKSLLDKVAEGRVQVGKPRSHQNAVVNLDEPYSNEIIFVMKQNGHSPKD